jgi:hypothetical protein
MPFESDLTNLTATFTLSDGATADPASPLTGNFLSDVTITVTAEDDETVKEWVVAVITAPAPAPEPE